MASWASRRKLTYASIIISVLFLVVALPLFFYFYKPATCFDGKKNGKETGLDCGGSCSRLCQSAFLPPRIEWGGAKLEKLVDGLYNAGSYIVNPNINGAATDVPYKISLYDSEGIFITDRTGFVTIYPRRNTLAFQTAIKTEKKIPTKATFEFTATPVWFSSTDSLENISILDKKYTEDENGSSLEVVLENKRLAPYKNILVSVILYDINGNAIGFSQTKIDSIMTKNSKEVAPFTWPINRNGKVASIEVLTSIKP